MINIKYDKNNTKYDDDDDDDDYLIPPLMSSRQTPGVSAERCSFCLVSARSQRCGGAIEGAVIFKIGC